MKKFITILMTLACSIVLFGCDNGENKFWEKSYANWQSFSQSEVYAPFVSTKTNIAYISNGSDIRNDFKTDELFSKLINYEELLDITMEIVGNTANKFSIRPDITNKNLEKLYLKFDKELGDLKTELDKFIQKDLGSRVTVDSLNSNNSKQHLIETKRIFKSVLNVANICKNTALEINSKVFNEEQTEQQTISASVIKGLKLEEIGYLIDAQIKYLECFDLLEDKYYDTNILENIKETYEDLENISDVTLKEYNEQKSYNGRLLTETKNFITALDNVDIQEYFTNPNYLNKQNHLQSYIDKVLFYLNF